MIRPGPLSIRAARSATFRPFLSFPSAKGCEVQRFATLHHERTFCLFGRRIGSAPPTDDSLAATVSASKNAHLPILHICFIFNL
jgi:hypothetical protein